jgi:hypothetical protein
MSYIKDGTRVRYTIDKRVGEGTVVGISATPVPVSGAQYIIHDPDVRNSYYPYEYFALPEIALEIINTSEDNVKDTLPPSSDGMYNILSFRPPKPRDYTPA